MTKKVAIIHTFLYSVEDFKVLFKKFLPEVEMINIIDDSLLAESLANKKRTEGVTQRMALYAFSAQSMGVDAILNQCSSVAGAVDLIQPMLKIPYVKVDQPMAEQAVRLGSKIAVIATAISTVEPSSQLVEAMGRKAGKDVTVERCFCEGAYDALLKTGDQAKHNEIVINTINKAAETNDVIVLAQGSMYKLLPLLTDVKKPVLTSLESGVAQLRGVLGLPPLAG
ncbi:MAG: aspartate/glutamate racemase family protein [Deltaproteobacteria bacterium]|jgi:Asp/Glu/hydantoin racemase|nr:aspartate/glutamate racemase family protein [Deltaproteobacteria bacterium]